MHRAVALLAMVLVTSAAVFGGIERGNRLYRAGNYAEAVEAYSAALGTRDDSPVLRYNLGTALLRLGRHAEAEEHLRAALDAIDPDHRPAVHYNLGQRFLEEARASEDPGAAHALYDAAVEAYRHALRLQPGDADARWNYELALRERDEQEEMTGAGDPEEGDPDDQEGGEGEGSAGTGSPDRQPAAGSGADHARMSQEEAERILNAIEQDERDLVRERLRQGQQEARPRRDW